MLPGGGGVASELCWGIVFSLASQGEPLCASGTPRHGRKVKEVLGMQLMLSKAEREGKVQKLL